MPHVLCRGLTIEPGLSDASEFKQASQSGNLYLLGLFLHGNLSLSGHCFLKSFKDSISQNL